MNNIISFHEGENLELDCKVLYPSNPLIVNPELAEAIGLEESIVVQQIKYWLNENKQNKKNTTHFHEGKWWTYNSLKKWHETNFRFIPLTSLRKIFQRLIDLKILITGVFNNDPRDRTLWYTINYLQLNLFLKNAFDPTGQMENSNDLDDDCNINLTNEKKTNAFDPTGQMQMTPQVKCYTETNKQRLTKEEEEKFFSIKEYEPSESLMREIQQTYLCSEKELQQALKEFKKFYADIKQTYEIWNVTFEKWCRKRQVWRVKGAKPVLQHEKEESIDDILGARQGEEREIMLCLLKEYDKPTFKSWLMHLELIDSNNDCVRFKVPNNFIREWIKDNYLETINRIVNALKPGLNRNVILCV